MATKIFVEGIADSKFVKDYISEIYGLDLPKEDIIESKGWTNILSNKSRGEFIKNEMQKNSDNEGHNLLIFDADNNFAERKKDIETWQKDNNLDFEIFLLPNNYDNGDLEVLLENIINPNNQPVFDCWEDYESCLRTKKIEGRELPLTTPARKTKIYGYLEALLGESKSQKKKIKEENRNYKVHEHWNLYSPYLEPLRIFLDSYFS